MNNLCVYCGSSNGQRLAYREAAITLADLMCEQNIGLVYGGASVGLMGVIADRVLDRGGHVIGVMPESLVRHEVAHAGLSELHVVDSMHARKALMADLADGFVALPGGFGTLDELFEMLTWSQLSLHSRPCGLLNVEGYFDALVSFMDHATVEGFVRPVHRNLAIVEHSPQLRGP